MTLSNITGQVPEHLIPNLSSGLSITKPGVFLSIMKQVIPLYPFSGSAFAITKNTPAILALDIQSLLPFIMKYSPSCFARVFRANASEPDSASDKQNDPIWKRIKEIKTFKSKQKIFANVVKVLERILKMGNSLYYFQKEIRIH